MSRHHISTHCTALYCLNNKEKTHFLPNDGDNIYVIENRLSHEDQTNKIV